MRCFVIKALVTACSFIVCGINVLGHSLRKMSFQIFLFTFSFTFHIHGTRGLTEQNPEKYKIYFNIFLFNTEYKFEIHQTKNFSAEIHMQDIF